MTPDEYAKKKQERQAAIAEAEKAQREFDTEKLFDLEGVHGDGRVAAVPVVPYVQGLPTLVVVRAPTAVEYKMYRDKVRKAGSNVVGIGAASDELVTSCRVYPDADTYAKLVEAFPGVRDAMRSPVMALAEGRDPEKP